MTATRPRKNRFVVNLNTLGGKEVDVTSREEGRAVVYDAQSDTYVHADVARADHDHDVGDLVLLFENQLI